MESCVVDGKHVYRKSNPKKEFRSLTKAQREVVIIMHKEHRAYSQERGVSAVRDSHDPPADTPDVQPSSSKRKAEAGSVGNFIHNRRSKKCLIRCSEWIQLLASILSSLFRSLFYCLHPRTCYRCAGFVTTFTNVSASRHRKRLRGLTPEEQKAGCRLGLDSHADVHCLGRHARIVEILEGHTCSVQPFNDSYTPMTGINIVNECVAYDTIDGETYIFDINQALDFTETMENSLLCTN